MRKILVVGGDIDVIRVLQDRLPDHKIVAVTEREARKQIILVDEHACPVADFFAELCRPMNINEINNIIIHESLELEAYQRHAFDLRVKPNPAARHYHKFTQPYGKDHRNGRRC